MLHCVIDPIIMDPITLARLLIDGEAAFFEDDHVLAFTHSSHTLQTPRDICKLAGVTLDGAFLVITTIFFSPRFGKVLPLAIP